MFEDSTYYYESGSLTYLLKKYIVKILNISYYIFGSNLPCSDFFFLFSKRDVSIFFHENQTGVIRSNSPHAKVVAQLTADLPLGGGKAQSSSETIQEEIQDEDSVLLVATM